MSWRQYGGTQKTTISTVNAGSIVANQFLSRSTAANINQFDNLKVKGQLLSQDFIQSGTYVQALGQLITSGNLFVKDSLFFGTDASRVNLPWTYITGNPTGISINNKEPEATLHITGLSFEVLKVDTSMNYIRNIIGQNVNAHGVVIAADDASSNIYFYNDVSTNILNKADSFIKNQPGSGLTIGSSSASVISLDNGGNVLISAAGTLSLFSTTGKFNISSNSTTLQSYLIVTNRGTNYNAKYNESAIIYDNSNSTYLKNVYDVSSALTGNSLSLLAIDNSSNTFLRIIDPSGSGLAVGGGAFPADTNRSFGSMFLSDFSGNYILSQNIVSGNNFYKYASTTGINTFIPKTENYVLDINGPTRIGNGELKTVFNANFEFKQVQFSRVNPNFGMAVGSSSSPGNAITVSYNQSGTSMLVTYPQYFSYTMDKGKTWNTLPIDIDVTSYDNFEQRSDNVFNSLYVYDTSFAIVGTNNSSLYWTNDGGLTWSLLIYNSSETSNLLFRETTNIYVSKFYEYYRVFLSFDYTNNINNTVNTPKYNTYIFSINTNYRYDPIVSSGYIGYNTADTSYNIQNYFSYIINPVTNAITYSNIGPNNYSYKINTSDSSGQYIYFAGDGIIKVDPTTSLPETIYNRKPIYLSQYNGIYVYDDSHVIAVGNNIISWTNDGTNWNDSTLTAMNIDNVNLQSVFIYDLSRAVAVGNNGLFIYTNSWQSSTWSIVPHELLNSSGIGSRIDGSNNQLRNIYMHSIDLFLISNVTTSYVPNRYNNNALITNGNYGESRMLYAYFPNLYNRVNNTVFEVSGNMFISGDLNINDGGKLMSNNNTFYLLNNTVKSIYTGNDASSIFIGNTGTINSMKGSLFVGYDLSVNSRMFVVNDVCMNSRLFTGADVSMNGNIYSAGRSIIQGDVSMNSRLFIKGDVSMNSRLFVTSDVSFGSRLFVNGDVSMNSRLFVTSDVSMGSRLFVNGDVSMNSRLFVTSDVSMGSRLFINGDVSMNSRLSIGSDTYVGGNFTVQKDVLIVGRLNVLQYAQSSIIYTNVTTNNYSLIITEDMSLNGRLFVNDDAYIKSRLFTDGDVYSFGRTIQQGDVSMNSRLFVNGDVSMNSRLFVTSDVSMGARLFVKTDASFGGNMYGFGRTINQGDVSMNSRLFVNGDVSMNSRLFVSSDVSMGARLFVLSDSSFGGNLYSFGRTINQGDVSINSQLFVNGDVSMNSRLFITSDVSMGARLLVSSDASFGSSVYIFGATVQQGDVSMNSRVFMNGDVLLYSRMFVEADVSLNNRLFVSNDVSLNGNLYTNFRSILQGDTLLNNRLFVANDVSMNNNVGITKNLTVYNTVYSAYYDICSNLYNSNPNYPNVANQPGVADSITIGNSAKFINIGTGQGEIGSTRTITIGAGNQTSSSTVNTIYLAGANDNLVISGKLSAQNFNLTTIAIPAFVFNSTQNNTTGTAAATNYGSSFSKIKANASSISSVSNIENNIGWLGAGFAIQDASLSTAGFFTVDSSGSGFYMKAPASKNIVQMYTDSLTYGATNFGNRSNIRNGILVLTTDFSLNSPINGNSLVPYSITVKPIDISNIFLRDDLVTDPSFQRILTSVCVVGDVSMNSRLFVFTDVSFTGNMYALGRSINQGDVSMNSRLFINGDVSMNSRLFVTSDVSMGARLFVLNDSSFGGNLYGFGRSILQGDVSMNSRLFIKGDVSMNSRLFITSDVSLGGRLFVGGDVSFNSRLFITSDVSLGGRLFVGGDVSFNSRLFITSDVSLGGRLFVGGDVSFNSRLFITSDVSLGGRLFVGGDVSLNSRLFVTSDVSMGARLFVGGDVSLNSRLFVSSDVSMNARLFVSGDSSYNGNLYTLGRTIQQGDVSMNSRLFINGDVSMNSRLFVTSDVSLGGRLFVGNDVIITGRLSVFEYQQRYVLYTNVTQTQYTMIVYEDLSLNGRLNVNFDASMNARLFLSDDASFNANMYLLGRSINQGDVSMNSRLFVNGDVSMNSRLFVTSDVSMGARLFVKTDASFGGNMYGFGRSILQGDVSMNSRLFVNGDVSMNSRLFVTSDVSMGARLFVLTDASFGGNMYGFGRTIKQGDVSMNSRLFVNGDVSMNSRLFVTSDVSMGARLFVLTDASFGGNMYGFGRTIKQGDVSMNSRLFVNGDVSMNSRLFVTSDVSMGGRLFVGGDVSMNSRLFLTSDASFGGRLFVKTDASFGGNMYIANNLFLGVSGNPYQVDLSGVINLRGTVNPITLIDDSVLLTNTPPLDFSNNYGSAWTPIYGITDETMNSISMSDNGQYQTVVTTNSSNLGFIYTSADYGFSWKKNTNVTNKFFTAVSVSANGKYQSATVYLGNIWTNSNYGLGSWTQYTTGVYNYSSNAGLFNTVLSTQCWLSISISSTGQYQTAITNTYSFNSTFGGDLYISSNYGSSWDIGSSLFSGGQTGPTGLPGYNPFNGITISSTGQYQATVVYNNFIYVSNDFGKKWIAVTNTTQQFFGISMSSSGQYITAVTSKISLSTTASFMGSDRGTIFRSSNYGLTWNDSAVNNYWNAITMTANGQYQTAVVNNSAKTYSELFSIVSGSNLISTTNALSYPAIILGSAVSGTGIPTGTVVTSNPVLANGNTVYQFYISNNVTSTSPTATLTFQSGAIYSSSNYGVTWYDNTIKNTNGISNTMSQIWQSQGIAMSANGQYQTAIAGGVGGYIYTSMTPYQQVLISNNLTVMSGDTTIYTRLFVINDVSMTSRLFVTSDVSMNARLFVGGDASYNGNLYTLGRTIKQGDVSMNSRLFVNGDVSMNSRLFITSDVSMNARLFVSGDASYNGNLYTLGRTIKQGDVSMNSRLFVNGDVSLNSRLFITSDVSMNARLFVSGDSSYNGNLYTLGRTINQGDVSMNSRLFINGDVSMNSRLFVRSDVSFGSRLFAVDASYTGVLYTLGRTINQGDVSMNSRLFINGDVSLNSRLFVTSDVSFGSRLFAVDASYTGNLYTLGRTINQGDVSMNSRLFANGLSNVIQKYWNTYLITSGATPTAFAAGTFILVAQWTYTNANQYGVVRLNGTTGLPTETGKAAFDFYITTRTNVKANGNIRSDTAIATLISNVDFRLTNDSNFNYLYIVLSANIIEFDFTVTSSMTGYSDLMNPTRTTVSSTTGTNTQITSIFTNLSNSIYQVADNVGIGTNNPQSKVDIITGFTTGGNTYSGGLVVRNTSNMANNSSSILTSIAGTNAATSFYAVDVLGSAGFSHGMTGGSSRYSFKNTYNFAGTEVMTILNDGKVGIGATSPTAPLQVNTSTTSAGGLICNLSDSANNNRLQFYDQTTTGSYPPYIFANAGNGLGLSSTGPILFYTNASATIASSAQRMSISTAGVVDINSATVSTGKTTGALVLSGTGAGLGVTGNVYANNLYSSNGLYFNNWNQPLINGSSTPQGAYMGWNYTNGGGETDFVNCKGTGGGGFNFYNIATGASSTFPNPVVTFTGVGDASFNGNVSIGGTLNVNQLKASSTIMYTNVVSSTVYSLVVNEDATFGNTTNPNASSTAAALSAPSGGLYVNLNLRVDGNIFTSKLNNGGTLTLPTSADTLVGRATTDALTNKTYNGLNITTSSGTLTIPNSTTFKVFGGHNLTLTTTGATDVTFPTTGTLATQSYVTGLGYTNGSGYAPLASPAFTGAVTINTNTPTLCIGTTSVQSGYILTINGNVYATAYNATSDMRIKTNLTNINGSFAVDVLRKLEPKKYSYIDKDTNADYTWGFIGQELESCLDHSIKKSTNFIPNVYDNADISNKHVILSTKSTNDFIVESLNDISLCKMRFLDSKKNEIIRTIDKIISDNTFTITESIDTPDNKIFVYGQLVDDFYSVNHTSIFTITTAAVKEIDRELQAALLVIEEQNKKIQKLTDEMDELKAIVRTLVK